MGAQDEGKEPGTRRGMTAAQGRCAKPSPSKLKMFVCSQLKQGTCWNFVFVFFTALVWVFLGSPNYQILSASAGPWVTFIGPATSVEEIAPSPIFSPSLSINNGIVYLPISMLRKRELEAQGDNSSIREPDSGIFRNCPSLAGIYGASSVASYSQALLPGV